MDRHHNLIIWAFVLQGKLTHENTIGKVDELRAGNYYCFFSAGAGGKHTELNIDSENMHAFYLWVLRRVLPPSMSTIGASPDSRLYARPSLR
jgi:redox-sensitive bicupin YhaK (pirin superfamily)